MTRTDPDVPPSSEQDPLLGSDVPAEADAPAGVPCADDAAAPAPSAAIPLLALEGLLFSSEAKFTAGELAEAAGVDPELAGRLWRAMGFPPVPDDESVFVEDDLQALRMAALALQQLAPADEVVYQTRVMAAALSRVAEVTSDNIVANINQLASAGMSQEEIAGALSSPDPEQIDHLIGYVYRRQLRAALWRKLADPGHIGRPATLAVGFVDLVRFTAVTEDIAEDQLGELIDRFETIVYDRVTESGGRVVKMIGDEVMFVADEVDQAATIAVDLVDTFHDEESVPAARAGLACGAVLSHGGDFFGPVVNLASRIVDVARPSTVVVSQEMHDALAGHREFAWRRLPPKRLKGIGRASLFAVSAARRRQS